MYSNFTVSVRRVKCLFRGGRFVHVQYVQPNRGPTKTAPTGQRTSDNSTTFSWMRGHLHGVLRHPCGAARQSVAYKYCKISESRKPYLKSGNSSKTAYSCNAQFVVSFLYVNVRKCIWGPTFLATEQVLLGVESHYINTFLWWNDVINIASRVSIGGFWCHVFHSGVFSAPSRNWSRRWRMSSGQARVSRVAADSDSDRRHTHTHRERERERERCRETTSIVNNSSCFPWQTYDLRTTQSRQDSTNSRRQRRFRRLRLRLISSACNSLSLSFKLWIPLVRGQPYVGLPDTCISKGGHRKSKRRTKLYKGGQKQKHLSLT